MANEFAKPRGSVTSNAKRRAYSSFTRWYTAFESPCGFSPRTAVSAVPVYSTYRSTSPLSMAFCTNNVPPRFALRSTRMPVRASICCARNSARTTCSVKNLELTTSSARERLWQALQMNVTSSRKKQAKRFISCDPQTAFQQAEQKIGQQRQQRGRYGSGENHRVVDHRDTSKYKCTEPPGANGSSNSGDADGNDGGGTNTGQDKTCGEGKAHAKKNLTFGHAHGFGGFDDCGIDAGEANVSVAQDGKQSVQHQRNDRCTCTDAAKKRQRNQKAEKRKAGNRLEDAGNSQRRSTP